MAEFGDPGVRREELLAQREFVQALARRLVLDPHRADDIAQDALLAALQASASPKRGPLRAWLTGVVRNLAYRMLRDDERRRRRETAQARPDSSVATGDAVAELELHGEVVEALLKLDEPYRTTLVLHFFEGLAPRAIAKRQNLPGATVRSHLHRGIEKLRDVLDERHGGDRRVWTLALLPLTFPTHAGAPSAGVSAAAKGLLVMSTKSKLTAAAALLFALGTLTFTFVWHVNTPSEAARIDGRTPAPSGRATGDASHARASVTGRVRLSPDGDWGTSVAVTVAGRRAKTDATGRFAAEAAPGNEFEVRASPAGFEQTVLKEPALASGETRDVGILWLQRAGTLIVQVVDRTGEPVAGASVTAGASGWRSGQRTSTRTFERMTDDAGRAEIAGIAGALWRVYAFRAGHGAAWRDVALVGERREIVLVLADERTLSGRVIDDTGAPVTGVTVLGQQGPFTWKRFPARPISIEVPVDGEGRYRMRGLAAAEVHLLVTRGDRYPLSIATVDPAAIDSYDLVYPRGGTVTGTVRDASGAPLADIRIFASCGAAKASARTRPDGVYRIEHLVSGSRGSVSASKVGFVFAHDAPPFRLEPGGEVRRDLVLRRATTLRGVVSDVRGPLPGARVFAHSEAGSNNDRTDAHGRFEVTVAPAGAVLLVAEMPGFHHRGAPLDRKAAWKAKAPAEFFVTDRNALVRIRLEPGVAVVGRTVDGEGRPVAHVAMRAQRITRVGNSVHTRYARHTASDAEGRFRFVLAPGGTFHVVTNASEAFSSTRHEITAVAGLELEFVVESYPRVNVGGVVTDPNGDSVAGIDVHCDKRTTRTDGEGRYRLDGVVVRRKQVSVFAGLPASPLGSANATTTGDEVEANIRLHVRRRFLGTVVDPDGRPIAGARAALLSSRRIRGEPVGCVTGADGTFLLEVAQTWSRIRVSAPGYVTVTLGAQNQPIELQPAFDVAGVVRTNRGRPVEGALVWAGRETVSATDTNGGFRLRGLAAGAHTVRVTGPRSIPLIATARHVVEAGALDLVLRVEEAEAIEGRVVGAFAVGYLSVAAGEHVEAQIERDGSFRLDGVPLGGHRLELRKRIDMPSGDRSFLVAALPDVTAGTRDVRFELDLAGEIGGTLVGVEYGWVLAYPQGSAGGAGRVPAAAAQLGARGAFRLTGLAGGLYTLWAIVEDGDKFRYVELNTVARTGDTNVDLRLNR